MASNIVEKFNHFEAIGSQIVADVDKVIRDTVSDLVPEIQAHAAVDTSAMRESVYAVTDQWSTYELAISEAKAVKPNVHLFPKESPQGPHEAVIGVAAEHSIFNEYGTASMAARPFFTPAIEAARAPFARKLAEAMDG